MTLPQLRCKLSNVLKIKTMKLTVARRYGCWLLKAFETKQFTNVKNTQNNIYKKPHNCNVVTIEEKIRILTKTRVIKACREGANQQNYKTMVYDNLLFSIGE